MADKIDNLNLYNAVEHFISNECCNTKNESFKINYHRNAEGNQNLSYLYDNSNCIKCIIKIKEDALINRKKDLQLIINNSSLELVLYKSDNDLNTIIK